MRNKIFIILFITSFLVGCQEQQLEVDPPDTPNVEASSKDYNVLNQDIIDEEETEEKIINKNNDKHSKKQQNLNQINVHYIDVGQGSAALIQFSDNEENYTILYDTGDWRGKEVVPYLQQQQIDFIDLVMISHPHADHIGQLKKIMDNFAVGEVWMTGNTANTKVYQSAIEAVMNSDADYDEPMAGEEFDIGPLEITILHPSSLTGDLNNDSLSAIFTYGNISFIFTGDAYKSTEKQIIKRQSNIQADFLHVGHHGSSTSSDAQFVKAVQPKYAIYSAATGNSYGHPHVETIDLFAEMGIPLYGTDVHGTIIVTTDGNTSEISTEKEGTVERKDRKESKKKTAKKQQSTTSSENSSTSCIDINHASEEELQQIKHIGEVRAKDLVELRPYDSVDQLTRIKGIGDGRLKDIIEENKACVQ